MMSDEEENVEAGENGAAEGSADNGEMNLKTLEAESEYGEALDPRAAELALPSGARDLEAVYEIPVQVSAVLGKSHMQVSQLLKLGRGAVVELDRKVGEAIDIYVNNRLVARGEVVVVDDKLGVTMTEIIKSEKTQS